MMPARLSGTSPAKACNKARSNIDAKEKERIGVKEYNPEGIPYSAERTKRLSTSTEWKSFTQTWNEWKKYTSRQLTKHDAMKEEYRGYEYLSALEVLSIDLRKLTNSRVVSEAEVDGLISYFRETKKGHTAWQTATPGVSIHFDDDPEAKYKAHEQEPCYRCIERNLSILEGLARQEYILPIVLKTFVSERRGEVRLLSRGTSEKSLAYWKNPIHQKTFEQIVLRAENALDVILWK